MNYELPLARLALYILKASVILISNKCLLILRSLQCQDRKIRLLCLPCMCRCRGDTACFSCLDCSRSASHLAVRARGWVADMQFEIHHDRNAFILHRLCRLSNASIGRLAIGSSFELTALMKLAHACVVCTYKY